MVERAHPLSAMAAASPDCAAVRLTALPAATRLVLRGEVIGMALPERCRATVSGERALLGLGPDEFLLLAPDETALTVAAASVVDVSHRNTALSVAGPRPALAHNS